MGDDQSHGSTAIGGKLTTSIEAKPADPEHSSTDEGQRKIVWQHLSGWEAFARADNDAQHQRSDACGDVNDDAASEVDDACESEESARLMPHAIAAGHIDDEAPDEAEDEHGTEFHALSKSTDE
jgi:hypothetical protein